MNNRKRKKAVSPVTIVLLLSLAIVISIDIYLWRVKQAEQPTESIFRLDSGVLDCQNLDFDAHSTDGCTKVLVENSGFFDIDSFIIRSFSSFGTGSEVKNVFVKAQESGFLDISIVNAKKVEVMPVIKVEGGFIGCEDVTKEIICTGLDDIQVEACNTADAQGTCSLLEGSGIVTCEECCVHLKKCCIC